MLKNKLSTSLIVSGMALVGLVAGIATMAGAQSATTTPTLDTTNATTHTVDTPEPGDVADATAPNTPAKAHGHAPLGGDGVVSSINGATIIMGEESDEGGASYTIDASKAAITKNGAAGSISDITVGAKIFVQGTTNGTNVSATSISVGYGERHADKANDTDGSTAKEASEPAGSSDASGE